MKEDGGGDIKSEHAGGNSTWKGCEKVSEPVVVNGVSSMAGGSANLRASAPKIAPSTCATQ